MCITARPCVGGSLTDQLQRHQAQSHVPSITPSKPRGILLNDILLAIDGGTPAFGDACPPWPQPDERVRAALEAAYENGSWGKYDGPHLELLVDRLREFHRVAHALPCCSGTLAVELRCEDWESERAAR